MKRVPANSYPKDKTNAADTGSVVDSVVGHVKYGRMKGNKEGNDMVAANATMTNRKYPGASR